MAAAQASQHLFTIPQGITLTSEVDSAPVAASPVCVSGPRAMNPLSGTKTNVALTNTLVAMYMAGSRSRYVDLLENVEIDAGGMPTSLIIFVNFTDALNRYTKKLLTQHEKPSSFLY